MKFSQDWSKLSRPRFTTIREASGYYRIGRKYLCETPTTRFYAKIIHMHHLHKLEITEEIALADGETDKEGLIKRLDRFYSKDYDEFVLITMERVDG
jgi:hypothetical protein